MSGTTMCEKDSSSDETDSSCDGSDCGSNIDDVTDVLLKNLDETLALIDDIGKGSLELSLQKASIFEFGSLSYLEKSPFGRNNFRVRDEFKEKLKTIGIIIENKYTFSEYCDFLTKYIRKCRLTNDHGIICPDAFLCDLLDIESKPCTFIKLMGASKKVFY